MHSRIVLISNDSDFFEYVSSKLILRKSDEVFRFSFDEFPEKLHLLLTSTLIVDSENNKEQTLELLKLFKTLSSIIFGYNQDEEFRSKCLKCGAIAFVTPLTSDNEFQAILNSALNITSILEKNQYYRQILVKKNLISNSNEVMLDYNDILENEIEKIKTNSSNAVLAAISPDDKSKFLLQPNQIETIILDNIRKNDILMSYAVNKYFLLLYDTDIENAKKIWEKIYSKFPEKMYAGFAKILSKSRQQVVNEVLNNLHEAINSEKYTRTDASINNQAVNFKLFKQDFYKKIEQVVNPTFYHIRQKYNERLYGVSLEQETSDGTSILHIKGRFASADFKITSPGFTKIIIDIIYYSSKNDIDAKRISLNPEELEAGLLSDLLEQFILEFKEEINDVKT